MKIIDLTIQLKKGMEVYPGDPEFEIQDILTVSKDEWNMKRIGVNLHDGTHVNAPYHVQENGKFLSDFQLDDFIAQSRVYQAEADLEPDIGIIFVDQGLTLEIAKKLVAAKVKFVAQTATIELDLVAERYLLEQGMLSFERLVNCEQLPRNLDFQFFGIPLNIAEADGSPVRAFAILEN